MIIIRGYSFPKLNKVLLVLGAIDKIIEDMIDKMGEGIWNNMLKNVRR